MTMINKFMICIAFVASGASSSAKAVITYTSENFTMLDSGGSVFGGTNDVVWSFDDTLINTAVNGTLFNGDIASDTPFYGFTWNAHEVRVFGEGVYTFDTTCTAGQIRSGISTCNNPLQPDQTEQYITIEVGPGQLGLHMLWDWNLAVDMDVATVWNQNSLWDDPDGSSSPINNLWLGPNGDAPDPSLIWQLVSTDADGDGFNGIPFVEGHFIGYSANFNFGQVPVPAAVWLFASGLIGLAGLARRKTPLTSTG